MKIKKLTSFFLILGLLLISSEVLIRHAESGFTVAPPVEGTLVKTHYVTYSAPTISAAIIGSGGGSSAPTGLPYIYANRTYTATTTVGGNFKVIDTIKQGIIEFDISGLTGLTPGTFTAVLTLKLNTVMLDLVPGTVSLWDLTEASEDGSVTTGETRSGFIGDLFSGPTYPGDNTILQINVTSALENDLGLDSFSGFLIDWGPEPTSFPLHGHTPEADFEFGAELTIVPEPTTLLLLGGGLVSLYLFRRRERG